VHKTFGFGREWSGGLVLAMSVRCPAIYRRLLAKLSGCSGHSLASRLNFTQRCSISVARKFVNFLSRAPYYIGPCPRRLSFLTVLITTGALRGHRHWHPKVAYRVPKDELYDKTSWNAHWMFRCILKRLEKMLTELIIRMHQQIAAFCVRSDMQLTVHDRGL